MSNIYTAPVYKLEELKNLFIELTAKNCNQRCKNCYIDFGFNSGLSASIQKTVKDFLPIEKIKEAITDTKNENIDCIYLSGAEPMTHPDFNSILRFCLKHSNVCICTNGSFLNEKKIRFLKKVEQELMGVNSGVNNGVNHGVNNGLNNGVNNGIEDTNSIIFKLSLSHFDEKENDNVKYRGHYRQVIFALKTLCKYNFNSVLTIQNSYKLDESLLVNMFEKIFNEHDIYNTDLQIIASYPDFEEDNFKKASCKTDCMYSRTLTNNGIYACPFLANDYRGRVGSSLKNFSKNVTAETDFCATCSKNNGFIFTIG